MRFLLFILILSTISCKKEVETKAFNYVEGADIKMFDYNELDSYIKNHPSETLVVNFWATWCAPCIKELPAFEKLGDTYADQDVKILLVSLDFPEQMDHLKAFVAKKELQSEVVFLDDGDANRWIPKVDKNWSGALPATLIIGDKRKRFYEQSFTYGLLESELKYILN